MNGRNVVVTGGSRGLGLAVVQGLLARGARVINVDLDKPEIKGDIDKLSTTFLNFGDPTNIEEKLTKAFAELGHIDDVIINAGIDMPGPVEDIPIDWMREMVFVNLLAPMIVSKHAVPYLRQSQGNLIFVTSRASNSRVAGHATYIASKRGLEGLAHSMERELAGQVGVMIVRPGGMHTDFHHVASSETQRPGESHFLNPQTVAKIMLNNLEVMHDDPRLRNMTISLEPDDPYLLPEMGGRILPSTRT